jgi:hypothetical protein
VTILTTLLAGITALSTSLLLAANLDIPPNPSGAMPAGRSGCSWTTRS